MKNIFKISAIMLLVVGSFGACNKSSDATINVTGTVIGGFSNGWIETFVQVDKKYPIGKTMEYIGRKGNCMDLTQDGTYYNMIRVQTQLPLSNLSENETVMNRRILFSYRPFNEEEDVPLFLYGHGNTSCISPDIPLYVITKCQIIK